MRDIYIYTYIYIYMQKFTIMYKPPPYSKSQLLLSDLLLATKGLTFDTELPYISMDCLRDSGLTFNLGEYHFKFDAETMTIEEKVREGCLYTLVDLKEDKLFSGDNSGSGYIPITTGLSVNGVSLDYGYATITDEGLVGSGNMTSCGQTMTAINMKASQVDAYGAIPQSFYKYVNGVHYNPSGLLSCGKWFNCADKRYTDWGSGCPIILDDSTNKFDSNNICYKLTTKSDFSFILIPNDTCNGYCTGAIRQTPNNSRCISKDYPPSCMDGGNWAVQNLHKNRCPPMVYCNAGKKISSTIINLTLENFFHSGERFRGPSDNSMQLGDYAPLPYGLNETCDWCSGVNMHFDVQFSPGVYFKDHLKTGQVVRYELIKCPNPYPSITPLTCSGTPCPITSKQCVRWSPGADCTCTDSADLGMPSC
jgi:hypothetical protein